MDLLNPILDLLFPPKCPFCGRVVDRLSICPDCQGKISWTGGPEVVRREGKDFCCAAPLWHEGLAREAVLRFKFHGGRDTARLLGELVGRCAAEELGGEFDTVTWVPVSPRRLRSRGFDQAELLARGACRLWDTEPVRLLVKTTENEAQSGIRDHARRRANVLGVYDLAPGAEVKGKRVLLIDDVCTSGATMRECARVLRGGGAQSVVCAALAHARGKKKV